jgi:hypothetical protein
LRQQQPYDYQRRPLPNCLICDTQIYDLKGLLARGPFQFIQKLFPADLLCPAVLPNLAVLLLTTGTLTES